MVDKFRICTLNKRPSKHKVVETDIVIVVPYQDEWQWMFAIEYSCEMISQSHSVTVISLDLLNRNFIKRFLLSLIGRNRMSPAIFAELKKMGVEVISPPPLISAWKFGECNFSNTYPDIEKEIFAHVVDLTGSINRENTNLKINTKKLAREAALIIQSLESINFRPGLSLFTPNGRYARNRAVKIFAQNHGIDAYTLDSASIDRYIVMRDAQSIDEGVELVVGAWESADVTERELVGKEYFLDRLKSVKTPRDIWTSQMKDGYLPKLNTGKKLCVFYTTTQIEFVGREEYFGEDAFPSQLEAIKAARQKLSIEEWDFFVRRHPKREGSSSTEDDLIVGLDEIPNITIIEATSPVDSYELAKHASLILHFGSHIGAEFTFLETAPVYAMNKTSWWKFDPDHHLFIKNEWEKFDSDKACLADPSSVLPFGYFLKKGGYNFKFLIKDASHRWTFRGIPLTANPGDGRKNTLL